MSFEKLLNRYKYEFLLVGIFQHLFGQMFVGEIPFYLKYVWPVNMIVLGFSAFGVFQGKTKLRQLILGALAFLIILSPIITQVLGFNHRTVGFVSITYVLFFVFVFYEVIKYLIKPSYINRDIIVASGCGYLLLIEIATFSQQFLYYLNPSAYTGIDETHAATIFIDFVYFSSVTITSIGFGDILPNVHYAKLLTSLFGIVGQFYSVILVGILISKFTNRSNT